MTLNISEQLKGIPASTEAGVFVVERVSENARLYVGRDDQGRGAILIATSDSLRTVPLRLAGIEASFATPCQVSSGGQRPVTETLTTIVCTAKEGNVEAYFASVLGSLLPFLGDAPTAVSVSHMVQELVELFQKLRAPARRSLIGLTGELMAIAVAQDAAQAIKAWRSAADDGIDFSVARLRMDVKSSARRERIHEVSFEQANPPTGAIGLIASLWIEPMAGGVSLDELLALIETRVSSELAAVAKLRSVVGDTLGDTLPRALEWRFDERLARSSFAYYSANRIPAFRPPLPQGVISARFVTSLAECQPLTIGELRKILSDEESGLLQR